jgi:hypothetical protein
VSPDIPTFRRLHLPFFPSDRDFPTATRTFSLEISSEPNWGAWRS